MVADVLATVPALQKRAGRGGMSGSRPVILMILAAAVFASSMGWSIFPGVWQTGHFADTDDALRMVQVRDLMAGQSWFDMTVYRLNPPDGLFIHWSRIVDSPLVILIKFFEVFLSPIMAERIARLAFPLLNMIALFYALARAARCIAGPLAIAPALVLATLAGIGVGQFQPGRIDHHAPQIMLLAFMLAFTLESLEAGQHKFAGYAAIAAAVSLGISIENITFIGAMSALWPVLYVLKGERARKPLFAYALGLIVALPLVFASTIGYAKWLAPACDALSVVYLTPALIYAVGSLLMTCSTSDQKWQRLVSVAALAAISSATLAAFFPQCLRGPLGDIDPLLRNYWLDNVYEARSLKSSLQNATGYTVLTLGPAFLCSLLVAFAVLRENGSARLRWTVVGLFAFTGIATTVWQVRAGSSLAPIALLGGVWAVLHFRRYLERRGIETAAILSLAAAIPLSSAGWAISSNMIPRALVSAGAPSSSTGSASVQSENCFSTNSYDAVAQLPKGLVIAPIDVGAHMLAHTHHSVLAAAYHRNNAGNRKALDILLAPEATAETLARAARADYIAICMGVSERGLLKKFAPGGLATRLAEGVTPSWLEEYSAPNALLRVFKLRSSTKAASPGAHIQL